MLSLVYRSLICFIVGLFWAMARNTYIEQKGEKGARVFFVLYSIVCALIVAIFVFGFGG